MQSTGTAAIEDRRRTQVLFISPSRQKRAFYFLIGGFALTIVLLALDGFVGFRGTATTRASLSEITQNQLLNVALIGQVQRLHSVVNAIGQRTSRENDAQLRSAIEDVTKNMENLFASLPADNAGYESWSDIQATSTRIARVAAEILDLPPGGKTSTMGLIEEEERVSEAAANLIQSSYTRAQTTKLHIEEATRHQSAEDRGLLAGCLAVAFLLFLTATRIYKRLNEQSYELSRVSWQLLEKQESLARRLSHELHDELGQSLTALKTNFSRHAALTCAEPSWMEDCGELLKESMRSAHEISQLLRPTILDDFGLDSALGWLCERFEERNRMKVSYASDFHERLEEQAETHLFRIAQEALTNVARHAHATEVTVRLSKEHNRAILTISDNGSGFSTTPEFRTQSFGLTGMKARARSLNGTMKIRTAAGEGTLVEVSFPVPETRDEETNPHLVG